MDDDSRPTLRSAELPRAVPAPRSSTRRIDARDAVSARALEEGHRLRKLVDLVEEDGGAAPLVASIHPERRRALARYVVFAMVVCAALSAAAIVRMSLARPPSASAGTPPMVLAAAAASDIEGERDRARRALAAGRLEEAIVLAERAVSHDVRDAETWLVLGAAYGEIGDSGAARSAFASCARLAERGPVADCRARLTP